MLLEVELKSLYSCLDCLSQEDSVRSVSPASIRILKQGLGHPTDSAETKRQDRLAFETQEKQQLEGMSPAP